MSNQSLSTSTQRYQIPSRSSSSQDFATIVTASAQSPYLIQTGNDKPTPQVWAQRSHAIRVYARASRAPQVSSKNTITPLDFSSYLNNTGHTSSCQSQPRQPIKDQRGGALEAWMAHFNAKHRYPGSDPWPWVWQMIPCTPSGVISGI